MCITSLAPLPFLTSVRVTVRDEVEVEGRRPLMLAVPDTVAVADHPMSDSTRLYVPLTNASIHLSRLISWAKQMPDVLNIIDPW